MIKGLGRVIRYLITPIKRSAQPITTLTQRIVSILNTPVFMALATIFTIGGTTFAVVTWFRTDTSKQEQILSRLEKYIEERDGKKAFIPPTSQGLPSEVLYVDDILKGNKNLAEKIGEGLINVVEKKPQMAVEDFKQALDRAGSLKRGQRYTPSLGIATLRALSMTLPRGAMRRHYGCMSR